MSTNRIIVLGGSGFLGTAIFKYLNTKYKNIVCGDIIPPPNKNIPYEKVDLLDAHSLKKNLLDYNLIINLTGQITNPFSKTLNLNTYGIFNLAKALLNKKTKLIHISSVSVYGSLNNCDEMSQLNPETNYAVAKATSEKILENILDPEQLTILRLSNLYGDGQIKGVIAYLLRSLHGDLNLNFNNNGNLIRSYLHTQDCIEMIKWFIDSKISKGVYNLVGPDLITIRELVDLAESTFRVEYIKHYQQIQPWENIKSFSTKKLGLINNVKYNWNLEKYFFSKTEKNE